MRGSCVVKIILALIIISIVNSVLCWDFCRSLYSISACTAFSSHLNSFFVASRESSEPRGFSVLRSGSFLTLSREHLSFFSLPERYRSSCSSSKRGGRKERSRRVGAFSKFHDPKFSLDCFPCCFYLSLSHSLLFPLSLPDYT